MPMSVSEAKAKALSILPESGPMPFEAWIDEAVVQGVEREILRSWPTWKARGEVRTALSRDAQGVLLHTIERGQ